MNVTKPSFPSFISRGWGDWPEIYGFMIKDLWFSVGKRRGLAAFSGGAIEPR